MVLPASLIEPLGLGGIRVMALPGEKILSKRFILLNTGTSSGTYDRSNVSEAHPIWMFQLPLFLSTKESVSRQHKIRAAADGSTVRAKLWLWLGRFFYCMVWPL